MIYQTKTITQQSNYELDFNDILLIPSPNDFSSRAETNLISTYKCPHSGTEISGIPIIAANMDGVGTRTMADAMARNKMFCALTKFVSNKDFETIFHNENTYNHTFYTIGINADSINNFKSVINKLFPPKLICIDIANGYMNKLLESISEIRWLAPNSFILAGNVIDGERSQQLIDAGASMVKVGIGSGAQCTTRIVAGIGRPQVSAIQDCAEGIKSGFICSDGGCVSSGDVGKAFACGADMVMLGSMLAATSASEAVENDGGITFYGMSSNKAMENHGNVRGYRSSEGRVTKLPYKGDIQNVINNILGGLRSTLSYCGAENISDLYNKSRAVIIKSGQPYNNSLEKYTTGT